MGFVTNSASLGVGNSVAFMIACLVLTIISIQAAGFFLYVSVVQEDCYKGMYNIFRCCCIWFSSDSLSFEEAKQILL